jgi:hypothetical protein
MFKKKKSNRRHEDFVKHLSEAWEAVDFPIITSRNGSWTNRNQTLSGLKAMLSQDNLKMYQDYVIQVNPEIREDRYITVRFREEGAGTIYAIKWIGSNFYKGK